MHALIEASISVPLSDRRVTGRSATPSRAIAPGSVPQRDRSEIYIG